MTSTANKFLHHYSVKENKKSGWISLIGVLDKDVVGPYTSSNKNFKGHFFWVCPEVESLPIYFSWQMQSFVLAPCLTKFIKKKKPIVYMFDSDQDNMVVLYKLPWNPNCKLLVDLPFLKTPNVDLDCESSVLSLPFFFHGQVLITNPWRRIRPRRQLRPRMRRQRPRSLKLTKHGPRRLRLRRLLLFGESERRIIWMIGFLHLTLGSS